MQVFPLGREVVPWPLSERFCSKSQGFPSPRLQNDGRRADFWGLGFSSPRLQNDGRRADFWRSEDSPPHVYRMLEEGQIVGVQGTPPSPRIQNAGGRADCWGSGFPSPRLQNAGRRADCWGSEDSSPHVYRMLEEGQIVGVQGGVQGFSPPHLPSPPWKGAGAAPLAVGVSLRSGWPLALLGELVQPVCFHRFLCRGWGWGCLPVGPPAAAVRQYIRNVSQ